MSLYEGYATCKTQLSPLLNIIEKTGTSKMGYFNTADYTDPPKHPYDCVGGQEKTIYVGISDVAFYDWKRVRIVDDSTDPPTTVGISNVANYQYLNMGQKLVTTGGDLDSYVRIGCCFDQFAYNKSTYEDDETVQPCNTGCPTQIHFIVKAIKRNGSIDYINLNHTGIGMMDGFSQQPEQDPISHQWVPVPYPFDSIMEQYSGDPCSGIETLRLNDIMGWQSDNLDIEVSIPFFDTESALDVFLETGVMTEPDNPYEPFDPYHPDDPDNPNRDNDYYIETEIYRNTSPTFDGATKVYHRRQEFKGNNTFLMKRYYISDTTLPLNMKWSYNSAQSFQIGKQITYNMDGGINQSEEYTSIGLFINPWHCGEEWHQSPSSNGLWWCSKMNTNIALVRDENDDPQPPLPGTDPSNPSGEDDPSTISPTPTLESTGSKVYLMELSYMQEFCNKIYDDPDSMSDLLDALSMYGANPINSVVDFYATPLDMRQFCDTEFSEVIFLGSYALGVEGLKVTRNTKSITVCSTEIKGTFGDWRDYDSNYYLYLPYVGFKILDTERYLNKNLTIKLVCDVRTGNIKYYLYGGGNILETYESTLRVDMPLTSSDKSSLPSRIIKASDQIVSSMGNKDVFGSLGGLIEFNNALHPPKEVRGNSSPSTALFDCNYPYLLIETPEYIFPPQLVNEYGLPDNQIAKLSNFTGYVECRDVQLTSIATESEQKEIETLCRGGIFI